MRRGAKELVHCVRYLLFAIQILKHGRIVDYGEANIMWKEMLEVRFLQYFETFQQISSEPTEKLVHQCSERISKYKDILKNVMQTYKLYGRAEHVLYTVSGLRRLHLNKQKNGKIEPLEFPKNSKSEDYGIATVKILNEKGLEYFESTYSVHTKRHSKHNNLVLFYSFLHTNAPQSEQVERCFFIIK